MRGLDELIDEPGAAEKEGLEESIMRIQSMMALLKPKKRRRMNGIRYL